MMLQIPQLLLANSMLYILLASAALSVLITGFSTTHTHFKSDLLCLYRSLTTEGKLLKTL